MLGKADATTASATGLSLEAQDVKASYGAVSVFQGVSRTIAAGEFVAPLGSSGCGNTNLLRAMSGFVEVAAGRMLVTGRDIAHMPPAAKHLAPVYHG